MNEFRNMIDLDSAVFGPAEASHLAEISKKDLSNWQARGHFTPGIDAFTPGGGKRLYTGRDILVLYGMREFSSNGVPLDSTYGAGLLLALRARDILTGDSEKIQPKNRAFIVVSKNPEGADPAYKTHGITPSTMTDGFDTRCAHILCADMAAFALMFRIALYQLRIKPDTQEEMNEILDLQDRLRKEDDGDESDPGSIFFGGRLFGSVEELEGEVSKAVESVRESLSKRPRKSKDD